MHAFIFCNDVIMFFFYILPKLGRQDKSVTHLLVNSIRYWSELLKQWRCQTCLIFGNIFCRDFGNQVTQCVLIENWIWNINKIFDVKIIDFLLFWRKFIAWKQNICFVLYVHFEKLNILQHMLLIHIRLLFIHIYNIYVFVAFLS